VGKMIFFIIPIFNEDQNVRTLISELREAMASQEYKIIAVNDGSIDRSLPILNELKEQDMVIESTIINMNVGAVFASGLDRALAESKDPNDIAIIMEGDQTSSVRVICELINKINERKDDVLIGSRYLKGGGFVNFPLLRRIYSFGASFLMRFYFPISNNVRDYTIFFRAYRIGIIRKAIKYFGRFGLIQSKGFVANAELLVKLSMVTDRISEIPFVYDYSKKKGKSKIRIFKTINEYFGVLFYLKSVQQKLSSQRHL